MSPERDPGKTEKGAANLAYRHPPFPCPMQ